ncbi:hypothetical protein RBS60_09460 [Sinomonas sp. ASV486]|uniref:hypothetical protein n=1 Tax=Sinomonas sp. ASV486 TaxID=3051170 RepID=UPI0027DC0767|nr:hypothetical protein [Sinomonas sp. ASV486]MDQ4490428.1 hypothetical protein [Sinomonas sp. ASV486]
MSWIFWVIALSWIVPFIMRRLGQPGPRGGRPPYQQGPYPPRDQYGQIPGQYPQGRYPGPQPPPAPLPGGQGAGPQGAQTPWWQQPLPPGFPGQPAPQGQSAPQPAPQPMPQNQQPQHEAPRQAQPAPAPSDAPAIPGEAPDGYRAKKLAELDRQFSDQKISLEEYMKARNEVMRG